MSRPEKAPPKAAPAPVQRRTVDGSSPLAARPVAPAPGVWGRCQGCRLVHAPGACKLTRLAAGEVQTPRKAAPTLTPAVAAEMRRERDPECAPPQAAGLVLADSDLMLAQAAAGDEDLVEWIGEAIRMRVTPRASDMPHVAPTMSPMSRKRKAHVARANHVAAPMSPDAVAHVAPDGMWEPDTGNAARCRRARERKRLANLAQTTDPAAPGD